MSMTAMNDEKGDVMIGVVEVYGAEEKVNNRGFLWRVMSWRKRERDDVV